MGKVIFLKSGQSETLTTKSKDNAVSVTNLGDEFAIKIIFKDEGVGVLARSPKIETLATLLSPYFDKNVHQIKVKINGGDGTEASNTYLKSLQEFFVSLAIDHPDHIEVEYDIGTVRNGGCMLLGEDLE